MDRRRYVPSGEGLEGRALLSTASPAAAVSPAPSAAAVSSTATTSTANSSSRLPENFQQKEMRIQNLPFFLESFQPGRVMPEEAVTQIQNDLRALAGRLHAPPSATLDNFNVNLRHAFPYNNLSPDTAKILNHSFTTVLAQAGTDPALVNSLSASMNQVALADSKSINPTFLAANDYALVLQTALAVGRPIPAPSRPVISPQDGKSVNNGAGGYTYKTNPTIVGSYASGASTDGFTTVQIIDDNGNILATGVVEDNGRYSAKIVTPLPVGTYKLAARAVDQLGHISAPSRFFTLKVAAPPNANA